MVKTTERHKLNKNKPTDRLRIIRNASIRRASSSSSSSAAAAAASQRNKRSSRLSINGSKSAMTSSALSHLNNDDNLSIYSREEGDDNQSLKDNKSDNENDLDSDNHRDMVAEKCYSRKKVTTQQVSGRGRGRKKKLLIIDSDDYDDEHDSDQSDYDTEANGEDMTATIPKQPPTMQTIKFAQITHLGKKHSIDTFQTIDVIADDKMYDLKQFLSNKQQPPGQPPELPKVNVEVMNEYPTGCVDFKLPINFTK